MKKDSIKKDLKNKWLLKNIYIFKKNKNKKFFRLTAFMSYFLISYNYMIYCMYDADYLNIDFINLILIYVVWLTQFIVPTCTIPIP